jgi:hypothetical protein
VDNRPRPPDRRQGGGVHLLVALFALGSLLSPPQPAEDRDDLVAASTILHAWDGRRESAWAASDAGALRSLYVRGSSAGAADVRLLRAYGARRLVVRRIVTQVFTLRVLHRDSMHLTLRVVDRVAGGVVATLGSLRKDEVLSRRALDTTRPRDTTRPLGTTRPVVRVVVLRRVGRDWKVAEVSARG